MVTQNVIDKAGSAAERGGRELRAELDGLSAQVEKLAGEISRLGKSGVKSARAEARRSRGLLSRTRHELIDGIGRELVHVEERAVGAVRDRPVQSLGLAVVLGFLLAVFLRR